MFGSVRNVVLLGGGFSPLDLFQNGLYSGFYYDFSKTDRTFQESTGSTLANDNDEVVGMALDESLWQSRTFAEESVHPANVFEDLFNYADQTALGAAGYTISEVGGALGVVVPGDGTVRVSDIGGTDSYIAKQLSLRKGIYIASVDLVAKDGGTGENFRLRCGTSANATTYVNSGWPVGSLTPNAGVYQILVNKGLITADNPWVTILSPDTDLGASLGAWKFQCLPGNHCIQTTSAARPLRKTGGFLRFDGSDDNLLTTLNPSASMTLVAKLLPATTGQIFGSLAGADTRSFLTISSSKLAGGVGADSTSTIVSAGNVAGSIGVAALTYNGTTVKLYWNGVEVYSGAQNGSPNTTVPYRIGALNTSGTASSWGAHDFYRALAINRALSASEILALTNFWGTT